MTSTESGTVESDTAGSDSAGSDSAGSDTARSDTARSGTAEVGGAYRLGPVEAIPVGEGRAFTVGDEQVAVFRLRDGNLRATQARCPHAGGPLADGQLDLSNVVCPLHLRAFSFADGRCAEGERVRLYTAGIEDGQIVVRTPPGH